MSSLESGQQPVPYPRKQYSTAGKIIALVLVVILVVGVSGLAALNYLRQNSPSGSSSILANRFVEVSGQVKSTGANTGATQVIFTPKGGSGIVTLDNGGNTPATVSVGVGYPVAPGTQGMYGGTVFQNYVAYLIEGTSYSVQVVYAGAFSWQGGAVSAGNFTVASSNGRMTRDFTVNTPDSWVGVSGTIGLQGNSTVSNPRPLTISWLSQNLGGIALHSANPTDHGGEFTATVKQYSLSQQYYYSLNVPNNDSYDLAVTWVSSSGSTGTCYVATFIGIGVIPIFVNVGNGGAYYTYNVNCNVSNLGV